MMKVHHRRVIFTTTNATATLNEIKPIPKHFKPRGNLSISFRLYTLIAFSVVSFVIKSHNREDRI